MIRKGNIIPLFFGWLNVFRISFDFFGWKFDDLTVMLKDRPRKSGLNELGSPFFAIFFRIVLDLHLEDQSIEMRLPNTYFMRLRIYMLNNLSCTRK